MVTTLLPTFPITPARKRNRRIFRFPGSLVPRSPGHFQIPEVFLLLLLSFILNSRPAAGQPKEKGVFKPTDLVELVKLDTTFHLDIRYATTNNFTGMAVYPEARAFLQRPAAEALVRAGRELKAMGFGLVIYDAYRPWSVTKKFWDITPRDKRQFVADPRKGSRHNRGCAVDVTLYELATGKEVEMTGGYDEMSGRSYPDYKGGTEQQRRMRDLLIRTMTGNGFTVYYCEWWHFDYQDWESYRIENVPFSEIGSDSRNR